MSETLNVTKIVRRGLTPNKQENKKTKKTKKQKTHKIISKRITNFKKNYKFQKELQISKRITNLKKTQSIIYVIFCIINGCIMLFFHFSNVFIIYSK